MRLSSWKADRLFTAWNSDFWASLELQDEAQYSLARSRLREPFCGHFDKKLVLNWCTFNGIVRGRTPAEMGLDGLLENPSAVLHSYRDMRVYMQALQKFWAEWPHSEADHDVVEKVSGVKLSNPWFQPSPQAMAAFLSQLSAENKGDPMSDEVTAPQMGRIWWSASSPAEAELWRAEYTAKGALVELKPEDDRPVVDVLITLDRAKANAILGYDVAEHEWLTEDDESPADVRTLSERSA